MINQKHNLQDKMIKIGKQLSILIVLILLFGCFNSKPDKNNWITSMSLKGGIYIKQLDDSLNIYALAYNNCDTSVVDFYGCTIVEQNKEKIIFKFQADRSGSISFYEDSTIFRYISVYDDLEKTKKLTCVDKAEDFENRIISKSVNLSSIMSEKIMLQERKIEVLSSKIQLNDSVMKLVDYLNQYKEDLMSHIFKLEYNKDLCWNRVDKLDEVLIVPQYFRRWDFCSIDVYQSRLMFLDYIDSKNINLTGDVDFSDILCSKLFDKEIDLDYTYVTAGEVVIFYNELILEIYKIELLCGDANPLV